MTGTDYYELTDIQRSDGFNPPLYRVRYTDYICVRGNVVEPGELGGWISKEATLRDGALLIGDKAELRDSATAQGEVVIKGNSHICGDSRLFDGATVDACESVGDSAETHLLDVVVRGNVFLTNCVLESHQVELPVRITAENDATVHIENSELVGAVEIKATYGNEAHLYDVDVQTRGLDTVQIADSYLEGVRLVDSGSVQVSNAELLGLDLKKSRSRDVSSIDGWSSGV